jgi:hypothetical protein
MIFLNTISNYSYRVLVISGGLAFQKKRHILIGPVIGDERNRSKST